MASKDDNLKGFVKGFFSGEIREELIFPYPILSSDEKETIKILLKSLNGFMKKEFGSKKSFNEKKFSKRIKEEVKKYGLYSLIIPQEFNGLDFSFSAYLRVIEEVAKNSFSLATRISTHQIMGGIGIMTKGSSFLKKRYLPIIASGDKLAAFSLTESGIGSDVKSIRSSAEYIQNKNGYLLNGNKIWTFNAPEAEIFIIFAKTVHPKQASKKDELTAFVVEKSFGIKVSKPERLSGLLGLETSQVEFNDLFVPEENIIGKEGDGFEIAVETLNYGWVELAAEGLGIIKKAIKISSDYATHRKQFGNSISEYGMIQEKIASMTIDAYILESMIYLTSGLVDAGTNDYSVEAAICKIFASESAMRVVDQATSICSSVAFLEDHWLAKILRDLRMMFFFQGTNEVLRLFISYSGLNDSKEGEEVSFTKALTDPIKSLGMLSDFLVKKISASVLTNKIMRVDPILKREASIIEEVIALLNTQVEKSIRKYGDEIMQKQFVIKRISDIAIKIYAMSSVVSRVSNSVLENGKDNSIKEIEIAIYVTSEYKKEILAILNSFESNKDEYLKDAAQKTYKYKKYKYDIIN